MGNRLIILTAYCCCLLHMLWSESPAQRKYPGKAPPVPAEIRNPVYKTIMAVLQSSPAPKRFEKVGIPRGVVDWVAALGYTDSTILLLKNNGIDLVKNMRHGVRDDITKTIFSDCIVVGTVSSVDFDSSRNPYHSIAHVEVEKYLRNDYRLADRDVLVGWMSGPLGHDRFSTTHDEDQLSTGEHVVLFLSAAGLLMDAKWNDVNWYENLLMRERPLFKIEGMLGGKYLLKSDGTASACGSERDLNDIVQDVHRVTDLLGRTP